MRNVSQTKFGPKEGNCFEACLSSITHISLDLIPSFNDKNWLDRYNKYLAKYELVAIMCPIKIIEIYKNLSGLFYIANGKSPRYDCQHAVVHHNGKMIHDPHPDNTGLANVTNYTFVFKINPVI